MAIRTYISIITLNMNGLNAPTKRHRLTERWQKTSDLPKGKKLPTYLGRAKGKRKNRDEE